ncbi:NACHT domain-containing protein [Streptomyces sp. NPDC091259]|uniref:NACHT domain-containing protein n=1 Tax=Streptomyces sp. NPDC091259 TaxID=3365976 RepID=UPI0037F137FB
MSPRARAGRPGRPWGALRGETVEINEVATLLREWIDEAEINVENLHDRLTDDHFPLQAGADPKASRVPPRGKMYDYLNGKILTQEMTEAVIDVTTQTSDVQQSRLAQVAALFRKIDEDPTPSVVPGTDYLELEKGLARKQAEIDTLRHARKGEPDELRLVERVEPVRAERAAVERSATRAGVRGDKGALVDEDPARLQAYLADVCHDAEAEAYGPYVGQSVVRRQNKRPADRSTAQPASAVFTAGPFVVLLGDPGGGKSELLRRHQLNVCRQWEAEDRSAALPVLVSATSLSKESLEEQFFARPLAPGSHWLILLDGLDEITNARARRGVLRRTVRWAAERRETHRLLVATRYLSEQEQSDLKEAAPVYLELLRFEAGDVRKLAETRLDRDQVDSLMAAIDEARLADLVTLPMIGAMLCKLHQAHPDRPLGNTRGAIYDAFITHLMATTPRTDTRPEHHAGKKDDREAPIWHSPTVEEYVIALATLPPADLRTLLAWVAARRRESSPARSVMDVLLRDLTKPPIGVPLNWWREQLIACFRRSGVLRQQGEELEFAHHTYEEFLAACILADRREPGLAELRRILDSLSEVLRLQGAELEFAHHTNKKYLATSVFGDPRPYGLAELRCVLDSHRRRHWPWRPAPGYRPMGVWGRRMWVAAEGENMSYLGFLIDRLTDTTEADLGKLPSSAGISGCTFLAAQKRLGTYLPAKTQTQAVEKLKQHIKVGRRARFGASIDIDQVNHLDPNSVPIAETLAALAIDDSRVDAATALLAFADSRDEGLATLRQLARSPRLTSVQGQVAAATAIVRDGDESGLDLIVELASNPGLDHNARFNIAWQLTALRRRRGLDLLTGWIDARTGGDFWFKAALVVVAIDEAYGVVRLKAIADDPACPALTRINAAYVVTLHNDPRGAEDLLRFARDPDLEEHLRVTTVHLLAEVGHPSAMAVRDELAQDPNLTPRGRKYLRRLPSTG